jgi:predicted RNA-binding Zn-ribbon protein involved in translation (DUF1610 family)
MNDYFRSPRLLKFAKHYACQNCGAYDGTIVAAHGDSSVYGKGRGIKSHDCYVAFLCHECHDWIGNTRDIDDPSNRYTCYESCFVWEAAHCKTMLIIFRAIQSGELKL